jgi:hypothetical protein
VSVIVLFAYALDAAGHRYGFTLGDDDASLPLVIDPLLFAMTAAQHAKHNKSNNGEITMMHWPAKRNKGMTTVSSRVPTAPRREGSRSACFYRFALC